MARDVAVVDVGGGARTLAVLEAVGRLDPEANVIDASDTRALYNDYGKACGVEGVCWARAAAAAAVQQLVLVPADDQLLFVDVADGAVRGHMLGADGDVGVAVERGLFPSRFGRLVLRASPADAVVLVDARPLPVDGVLRTGAHQVRVEAPGYTPREIGIEVNGGQEIVIDSALSAVALPAPAPKWIWSAAGAGVAVVGLGVGLAAESAAGGLLEAAPANGLDLPRLRALEAVELASFVVAAAATAAAVGILISSPEQP